MRESLAYFQAVSHRLKRAEAASPWGKKRISGPKQDLIWDGWLFHCSHGKRGDPDVQFFQAGEQKTTPKNQPVIETVNRVEKNSLDDHPSQACKGKRPSRSRKTGLQQS